MRWRDQKGSANVEDRRGMSVGRGAALGGGGLIVMLLFALLTGQDPGQLAEVLQETGGPPGGAPAGQAPTGTPGDQLGRFAGLVLGDTEATWNELFGAAGRRYREPTMVLFTGQVRSGCGFASAAVGPFYCPADGRVYLDLGFFDDMSRRFGAPGDFAQAYVIAHEVGHHVQNLLGVSEEVRRAQRGVPRAQANALSVRLELQADCFAGVWGHHANRRGILEPGDVEEGLRAASAIGDDKMQARVGGTVRPESWTHGSGQQRVEWLRTGLERGDPNVCDTFSTRVGRR